ncbi:MAG: sulfur oxidation c-type cytochrome SoxX [Rhodospirillaceae bacterium]|nr:sulfur oxidation c-type cytochrome SoxX [Rhodospirillaceae bacterium]
MKNKKLLAKLSAAAFGVAVAGAISFGAQAEEMVSFEIVDETIPQSLTGKAGDPVAGRKTAINRKKGNCLACHVMPIPEQQFHGLIGPTLDDTGDRFTEAELRMRMVDSKVFDESTMMPSFYKTGQHMVLKKFVGKTILSAQEVEDVVAYLMTLK